MPVIRWLRRLFRREPEHVVIERVPPGLGWHHWPYTRPPMDAGLIEFWRAEWAETQICHRQEISPQMGVWGLYWRWPEARLVED